MFFLYTFQHSGSTIAIVANRKSQPKIGDSFDDFFISMELIKTFAGAVKFPDLLADVVRITDASQVVVIANDELVTDSDLRRRLENSLSTLEQLGSWSVAASMGLEWTDQIYSAIYSSAYPTINYTRDPKPIIDCGLDLFVLNGVHLRTLLTIGSNIWDLRHFAQVAIIMGYLNGRVAVFLPQLAAGILGPSVGRIPSDHQEAIDSQFGHLLMPVRIPFLSGETIVKRPSVEGRDHRRKLETRPLDLELLYVEVVKRHCTPTSLSIVTRTQFSRPHLLKRLLTSVSRARSDEVATEIILSTDIAPNVADQEVDKLQKEFPHLTLRLAKNGQSRHSRVENLVGGIRAAQNDYVVIVDDDDFLDVEALEVLKTTRFSDAHPLVITDTRLANEIWTETPSDWILSSTTFRTEYSATGWRKMFGGSNRLPICSMLIPREWLVERISQFSFENDLSEDYTLFLLLLTSPDLPLIREISQVFVHVSVREDGSNTITVDDRRQWVQDITRYLSDLFITSGIVGEGVAQILTSNHHPEDRFRTSDHEEAVEACRLYSKEIDVLRREVRHLRALLVSAEVK